MQSAKGHGANNRETAPGVWRLLQAITWAGLLLAGSWNVAVQAADQGGASSAPLTKAQVKRYLQIEIELNQLLRRYQANAAQYEDAPRAFALAEEKHLASRGFSEAAWDALETRIMNASTAITDYPDLVNDRAERKSEVDEVCTEAQAMAGQQGQMKAEQNAEAQAMAAQMRAAGIDEAKVQEVLRQFQNMPTVAEVRADQCQQMAPVATMIHEDERRWIETSRPDWPAVRPYLDELDQLTDWAAGNTDQPPVIN